MSRGTDCICVKLFSDGSDSDHLSLTLLISVQTWCSQFGIIFTRAKNLFIYSRTWEPVTLPIIDGRWRKRIDTIIKVRRWSTWLSTANHNVDDNNSFSNLPASFSAIIFYCKFISVQLRDVLLQLISSGWGLIRDSIKRIKFKWWKCSHFEQK